MSIENEVKATEVEVIKFLFVFCRYLILCSDVLLIAQVWRGISSAAGLKTSLCIQVSCWGGLISGVILHTLGP